MLGQKLGHKAKLKENLVNTLAVAIFASAVGNFFRMFLLIISKPSLNMGHIGLETCFASAA